MQTGTMPAALSSNRVETSPLLTWWQALRRSWPLVLVTTLLLALAGAGLASALPERATASATLLVQDPRSTSLFDGVSGTSNYVPNQIALLSLPSTLDRAAQLLDGTAPGGAPDGEALAAALTITGAQDNDLVTVSVTDRSPLVAQAAVGAVVEAYREVVNASAEAERTARIERISAAIGQVQGELARAPSNSQGALQDTYEQLVAQRAQAAAEDPSSAGVELVSEASLPTAARAVRPAQGAVVGAVLGALAGALLCRAVARARRRFGDRFAPESTVAAPLLSDVPDFRSERLPSDLPTLDAPASAAAESFRFASTLMHARRRERGPDALAGPGAPVTAMVSASSQDGKSTIAANLAITATQSGRRVLAIDGDLGGRGLSFLLLGGRTSGPGFTDVLEGRWRLEHCVEEVLLPGGEVLSVLRAGTSQEDAAQLLSSSRCRSMFAELEGYDEVLVDVPPLLQVAYASSLAIAAGNVVVVVPHRSSIRRYEDLMRRTAVLGLSVVGYVYNRSPLRPELGQQSAMVTDQRRRIRDESSAAPRQVTPAPRPGAAVPLIEQPRHVAGSHADDEPEGSPGWSRAEPAGEAELPPVPRG
ncbi:MAG: hypothetical protein JWN88_3203 [Frankiales bacterium]|nr:hypothetical protein [Frankiales bacterium]